MRGNHIHQSSSLKKWLSVAQSAFVMHHWDQTNTWFYDGRTWWHILHGCIMTLFCCSIYKYIPACLPLLFEALRTWQYTNFKFQTALTVWRPLDCKGRSVFGHTYYSMNGVLLPLQVRYRSSWPSIETGALYLVKCVCSIGLLLFIVSTSLQARC